MQLRYEPRAVRALKRLGPRDRQNVVAAIETFARGDAPNADVKKLHAMKPATWRLRVGDFRVLYRHIRGAVVIVDLDDRKDIYRR
jgi:mRNA interferase RelE/StbE